MYTYQYRSPRQVPGGDGLDGFRWPGEAEYLRTKRRIKGLMRAEALAGDEFWMAIGNRSRMIEAFAPTAVWRRGLSESTKLLHRRRMRCRRLPTTRPTPIGLQEPICHRKKCAIWTRWRPVPVKNVNYPRAPNSRRSGLVGPHTTPPIVNYKYMPSTL